ncbi:hypothetical protein DFH09DRAFT_954863 [Mycena vulgaris]|nr:hypothetical protein DFH09DRAFT_954863 [Mycena vulgaris]
MASAQPTSVPATQLYAGKIRIPASQTPQTPFADITNAPVAHVDSAATSEPSVADVDNYPDLEDSTDRRSFCPTELRQPIIDLMEQHLNAHPLIPGYAHPSSVGIRWWAVKQMYDFCYQNNLPEVWAYLWENWYRRGRWELWARAEHPEIPRLKTTMMVESHWRRIKKDFLHHFHKPRLDLLVWILVTKLAPNYYRRLDIMLNATGRFRDQPSWRKAFKAQWRCCQTTPISLPLNPKY